MAEHTKDPFRLVRKPLKKYVEPVSKPGDAWFKWPKCQSINISLIDCKDKAEVELHAPNSDGQGGWLILYLCRPCLGRYHIMEGGGIKHYLVEHRLTNEVIVYEAIEGEYEKEDYIR